MFRTDRADRSPRASGDQFSSVSFGAGSGSGIGIENVLACFGQGTVRPHRVQLSVHERSVEISKKVNETTMWTCWFCGSWTSFLQSITQYGASAVPRLGARARRDASTPKSLSPMTFHIRAPRRQVGHPPMGRVAVDDDVENSLEDCNISASCGKSVVELSPLLVLARLPSEPSSEELSSSPIAGPSPKSLQIEESLV